MQNHCIFYIALSACVMGTTLYVEKSSAMFGEVYLPSDNNQILFDRQAKQRLGKTITVNQHLEIEASNRNSSASELIDIARKNLDRASRTGDDRFVSYADRDLNRWQRTNTLDNVPQDLLVMQARVAQRLHDFRRADAILNDVLTINPNHGEANMVLAYSLMAQGKADHALRHCRAAMKYVDHVLGLICQSRTLLLQGRKAEATKRLSFLSQRTDLPTQHVRELTLTLAEMASWQGNSQLAERYLRDAISLDEHNVVAKIQLADLLLEQARYVDAKHFLQSAEHPALQLRLWIASAQNPVIGKPHQSLVSLTEINRARALANTDNLEAATRDDVLLLMQAGYQIEALAAARKMWSSQREPDDALMYMRIAKQQSSNEDVRIVHRWMLATGLDDARLKRYLSGATTVSTQSSDDSPMLASHLSKGHLSKGEPL